MDTQHEGRLLPLSQEMRGENSQSIQRYLFIKKLGDLSLKLTCTGKRVCWVESVTPQGCKGTGLLGWQLMERVLVSPVVRFAITFSLYKLLYRLPRSSICSLFGSFLWNLPLVPTGLLTWVITELIQNSSALALPPNQGVSALKLLFEGEKNEKKDIYFFHIYIYTYIYIYVCVCILEYIVN